MEPNAPPPSAAGPPYAGAPAHQSGYAGAAPPAAQPPHAGYEYVPHDAQPYAVDQGYYVNGYNTHYVHESTDDRYPVEHPMTYYQSGPMEMVPINGYPPQHMPPGQYMPPGYPQAPGPSGAVYTEKMYVTSMPHGYPADPNARPYPEQVRAAYPPPMNRNVTQILNASREQAGASPVLLDNKLEQLPAQLQLQAAKAKKRLSGAAANGAAPPPSDKPAEPKKQFQCQDCQKCVSSARNLKRHENSCKAKKQAAASAGPDQPPPQAAGSPAKQPAAPAQPPKPPPPPQQHQPHQHYAAYAPPPAPPPPLHPIQPGSSAMPYPGQPPHHAHRYAPYAPHTALPQVNPGPMFEYPSSGMSGGLHSAPPVMSNYSPQLPPYSAPNSQQMPSYSQRNVPSVEYSDSSSGYGFNSGMDSFIENAIDEVAHNPLAYIGGPEESGHSGDHSMSSDYANSSKDESKEPKLLELGAVPQPRHLDSSQTSSEGKMAKKTEKNTKPTNFQCDDCKKYMCSQRSLRRHRTTCKMVQQNSGEEHGESNSEDKAFYEQKTCECGATFANLNLFRQHLPSCPANEKDQSTNQSEHSFSGEKTMMPPPEAQEPKDKLEHPEGHSDVTVGEHLRQIHGKPGASVGQKKAAKKPSILNRRPKEEEASTTAAECAEPSHSAEEASRKSEQVADVVNSVVEKIRRQNEAWEGAAPKRAAPAAAPPAHKLAKLEPPPEPHGRPAPPKPLQLGPPLGLPHPHHPHAYPVLMGQSAPVPAQPPPAAAAPPAKDQPRYLCPECCKTYSCRKNMRGHRMSVHGLAEEQMEGERAAKRVKISADGFIVTPGFERENEIIRQNKEVLGKSKPSAKKTSAAHPVSGPHSMAHAPLSTPRPPQPPPQQQPQPPPQLHQQQHQAPPPQQQHVMHLAPLHARFAEPSPAYLMSLECSQHSDSSTPHYEELQPMSMDLDPTLGSAVDHSQQVFAAHADDLDVWDQIKSRVDGPFTHTRADEMDVARIAADLKRSAEESQALGEIHSAGYNSVSSSQFPDFIESRKPVELAEADSTFCEEMDDATDRISSTMSCKPSLGLGLGGPDEGHFLDQRTPHGLDELGMEWSSAPPMSEPVKKAGQPKPSMPLQGKADRKRACPTCGRLLSSDYSLKRHSAKCKQGGAARPPGHESGDGLAPAETSTDDSHAADPDSTTINPPATDLSSDSSSQPPVPNAAPPNPVVELAKSAKV